MWWIASFLAGLWAWTSHKAAQPAAPSPTPALPPAPQPPTAQPAPPQPTPVAPVAPAPVYTLPTNDPPTAQPAPPQQTPVGPVAPVYTLPTNDPPTAQPAPPQSTPIAPVIYAIPTDPTPPTTGLVIPTNDPPPVSVTKTYPVSQENFLNTERGFRPGIQLMGNDNLARMRGMGYAVVQAYVSLRGFKNGPISDAYLNQLSGRLKQVRDAGLKVSLRFWYSWGPEGSGAETDAPKAVVLNHIQQLKPIFNDYADVIMVVQAGFIGAWGEWHSSISGLATPDNQREITRALLAAIPKDRRVQVRTVAELRTVASVVPVDQLGHHNDCFMINQSDAGTYAWSDPQRKADRDYLQGLKDQGIVVGGEMCGDVTEAGTDPFNRRTPEGQLAEFERFGWSWIANDFGGVQRWKDWGIYDVIARRLGYRLELLEATMPVQVKRTGKLQAGLKIRNSGFAAPFNPRLVRLVLRGGGKEYIIPTNSDPRRWKPSQTQTLNIDQPLPADIVAGNYEVLLHLADPYPTLTKRPEYAIRLANSNIWEATTGYNQLLLNVAVLP